MSESTPTASPSPSLVAGQRLDQPTFHALYEAMPPGTRAELIGGVVHMPSPVGRAHGRAQVPVIVWLDYYAERTVGIEVLDNATAILGWKNEPQPDVMLRVQPECGGRTADAKGFVRGAPELVLEVSRATQSIDPGPKLADYEQAGVLDDIVRALTSDEILWFDQRQSVLTQRPLGEDWIYRSEVFPGLRLDPQALIQGDRRRLRHALDRGCATPEHAAFVARLAAARVST
jgi:Uma2 family endonuclease